MARLACCVCCTGGIMVCEIVQSIASEQLYIWWHHKHSHLDCWAPLSTATAAHRNWASRSRASAQSRDYCIPCTTAKMLVTPPGISMWTTQNVLADAASLQLAKCKATEMDSRLRPVIISLCAGYDGIATHCTGTGTGGERLLDIWVRKDPEGAPILVCGHSAHCATNSCHVTSSLLVASFVSSTTSCGTLKNPANQVHCTPRSSALLLQWPKLSMSHWSNTSRNFRTTAASPNVWSILAFSCAAGDFASAICVVASCSPATLAATATGIGGVILRLGGSLPALDTPRAGVGVLQAPEASRTSESSASEPSPFCPHKPGRLHGVVVPSSTWTTIGLTGVACPADATAA